MGAEKKESPGQTGDSKPKANKAMNNALTHTPLYQQNSQRVNGEF